MRLDKLKQYVSLRQALVDEKRQIEGRLGEINDALATDTASPAPAPARTRGPGRPRRKFKRARNEMSLKEAVLQATKGKALTKAEILASVSKAGYKFTAKDPVNSLNTLLYGGKTFKKHGAGKFGPA